MVLSLLPVPPGTGHTVQWVGRGQGHTLSVSQKGDATDNSAKIEANHGRHSKQLEQMCCPPLAASSHQPVSRTLPPHQGYHLGSFGCRTHPGVTLSSWSAFTRTPPMRRSALAQRHLHSLPSCSGVANLQDGGAARRSGGAGVVGKERTLVFLRSHFLGLGKYCHIVGCLVFPFPSCLFLSSHRITSMNYLLFQVLVFPLFLPLIPLHCSLYHSPFWI